MIRIHLFLLLGATYILLPSHSLLAAEDFIGVYPHNDLDGEAVRGGLWMNVIGDTDLSDTAAQLGSFCSRSLSPTGSCRNRLGGKDRSWLLIAPVAICSTLGWSTKLNSLHLRGNVPHYLFLQSLRL